MTVDMNCRHRGTELTAGNEGDLVERVQAHASTHDGKVLTRDHILHRFHVIESCGGIRHRLLSTPRRRGSPSASAPTLR